MKFSWTAVLETRSKRFCKICHLCGCITYHEHEILWSSSGTAGLETLSIRFWRICSIWVIVCGPSHGQLLQKVILGSGYFLRAYFRIFSYIFPKLRFTLFFVSVFVQKWVPRVPPESQQTLKFELGWPTPAPDPNFIQFSSILGSILGALGCPRGRLLDDLGRLGAICSLLLGCCIGVFFRVGFLYRLLSLKSSKHKLC